MEKKIICYGEANRVMPRLSSPTLKNSKRDQRVRRKTSCFWRTYRRAAAKPARTRPKTPNEDQQSPGYELKVYQRPPIVEMSIQSWSLSWMLLILRKMSWLSLAICSEHFVKLV
jgi:hypothetical protein